LAVRGINDHLFVVISDPSADPDRIVTANFTTWAAHKDQSCIVEVGEHRFITRRSCMYYGEDRWITLVEYEGLLVAGRLVADEVSDPLPFERVGNKIQTSVQPDGGRSQARAYDPRQFFDANSS
jgi:hypothetical protein